jgi:two-component sensor histidine kinase
LNIVRAGAAGLQGDCRPMVMQAPFTAIEDARALAQAIVDTVREPLLVLNKDLRVVVASRSFYRTFDVAPDVTEGRTLFGLGDGQWNIPALRSLLENVLPKQSVMEAYEVEHDFLGIGPRTMLLNAREVVSEHGDPPKVLLAIEDITERRVAERKVEDLLQQKEMLLEEMQHRVANSLQIIASILLLKARAVQSPEVRIQLEDAHQRVLSVAAVQKHLQPSGRADQIDVGLYLGKLCETLADSMIGDSRAVSLKVIADSGVALSSQVVSIGLIVTELVMNALKHAFPNGGEDARITVSYEVYNTDWRLAVADNGIGKPAPGSAEAKSGLGTSIVKSLAQQLDARVDVESDPNGTTVSISHATFKPLAEGAMLGGTRARSVR